LLGSSGRPDELFNAFRQRDEHQTMILGAGLTAPARLTDRGLAAGGAHGVDNGC
jgi:hypothetical protein